MLFNNEISNHVFNIKKIDVRAKKLVVDKGNYFAVYTPLKMMHENYQLGIFPEKKMAELVASILITQDWNFGIFSLRAFRYNNCIYEFRIINEQICLHNFKKLDTKTYKEEFSDRGEYGEHIQLIDDKFNIIKEFDGKDINFGSFKTHKVAIVVRNILNKNGWNMGYFFNNDMIRIGNAIYLFTLSKNKVKCVGSAKNEEELEKLLHEQDKIVKKRIKRVEIPKQEICKVELEKDGKLINFGSFKSKIAKLVETTLIENNLDPNYFKNNSLQFGDRELVFSVDGNKLSLFSEFLVLYDIKSRNGVAVEGSEFIVYANGDKVTSFRSKNNALLVADILNENNWNINHFKNNKIFEKNGKYYGLMLKDNDIKFLGIFKSREAALEVINKN